MPLESTFSYSNAPHAIMPRKKYREEDAGFTLMSDPRVVRGSVSRSAKTPGGNNNNKSSSMNPAKNKSRGYNTTSNDLTAQEGVIEEGRSHRPTYVYQVENLVRPEIDLTHYLVQREDDTTTNGTTGGKRPPKVAETQTDKFQERPDTPEYVPRKTGVDVCTQVDNVSDLFIFDLEVAPMLAVICGKTLEQAMFEIEREGELVNLQTECDRFEGERVVEQQWRECREQETLADSCTKELALKGFHSQMDRQREVRTKVAGMQAMSQMLPAVLDNIMDDLFSSGDWVDPVEDEVNKEGGFLDSVYLAARQQLEMFTQAQALVDGK
jgi:hypothetical protein